MSVPVSCFSFCYGVCGRTERQPTDGSRLLLSFYLFFTACGGLRERTGLKMGQMDVQIPVTGSGLWLF